jgi:fructose 1,6-bisphosphatase
LTETKVASDMNSDDRMFKLTGATRLGREQQYVGFPGTPEVISEEYETNDLRLELASKLLDQERLDDARRVLDEVTKDASRRRA